MMTVGYMYKVYMYKVYMYKVNMYKVYEVILLRHKDRYIRQLKLLKDVLT